MRDSSALPIAEPASQLLRQEAVEYLNSTFAFVHNIYISHYLFMAPITWRRAGISSVIFIFCSTAVMLIMKITLEIGGDVCGIGGGGDS